jgi:hypothetical protein
MPLDVNMPINIKLDAIIGSAFYHRNGKNESDLVSKFQVLAS